jgi:hypothetical protein
MVIKWRRTRWARHVARMGQMRNVYKIFAIKPKGNGALRRSRLTWRVILERILRKWVKIWVLESSVSGQGPVVGSCEYGDEPSGYIKGRGFPDHNSDY